MGVSQIGGPQGLHGVFRGFTRGIIGGAPLRDHIGGLGFRGFYGKNPDGCRKKCSREGAVEAENGFRQVAHAMLQVSF